MAVRGMNYKRHQIYSAFNKYVKKSDYAKDDRDTLMERLELISSMVLVKNDGSIEPNEKS
jgi:hypothetical protein